MANTTIVSEYDWEYDVFVSYTRFDETLTGLVQHMTEALRTHYKRLTGRPLRIFQDTEALPTAALWQDRILSALRGSATLLAIYTPSYFQSEWCAREWDFFLAMEPERRQKFHLGDFDSLVFPIIAAEGITFPDASSIQHTRQSELQARQALRFVDLDPTSLSYAKHIATLARHLARILALVAQVPISDTPDGGYKPQLNIPLVTTSGRSDVHRLTTLLADAESAIIIGVTNDELSVILEPSLKAKRLKARDEGAFWDSLRIVFLAEDLLAFVEDHFTTEISNPREAHHRRARHAGQIQRQIMSLLIRQGAPGHWRLYAYPYALPFAGYLFTMPDGRRIVQLEIARASRMPGDNVYIQFVDRVDTQLDEAFREVVSSSQEQHEIVLIGTPGVEPGSFACRGARFRRSVLLGGHNTADFLPCIVAITWRASLRGVEPLLQLNTPSNSTREMGKASHVSGYINERDYWAALPTQADRSSGEEMWLTPSVAVAALHRELQSDFGIEDSRGAVNLVATVPFYYADKENLFFFVLEREIPAAHLFSANSRMFGWSIDELLAARFRQVLQNAIAALQHPLTARQRERALKMLTLNLHAHGQHDLADMLHRLGESLGNDQAAILALHHAAAK